MARLGATNNINTNLPEGWSVGIKSKGGYLTDAVKSGDKKFFAVGDYARVLGVKPGTGVDLSSYDPATVKAVQELAWKKNQQAADENKAKLKKAAIMIGAAALGGAALGAWGGAAAAAATPGAAAAAPTATAGASLGATAGTSLGATAAPTAATGWKALAAKVLGGGGSGGFMKAGNAALQAYSAYDAAKENKKLAKEAGKPKDTKRSPYYNEALASLIPYLLAEQARVYQRRMQGYGARPGDYTPFAQLLQQIPSSYRG